MQRRMIWVWSIGACSIGLSWACARPLPGPTGSSSDSRDAPGPSEPKTASAQPKTPPAAPDRVNDVFCLEAPAGPIPPCSESRSARVDLRPLIRATYLGQRGSVLEVGGLAASARWSKRGDKNDAVFVEVEGGRVTKVVRDDPAEIRNAFLAQDGGYRLLGRVNQNSFSLSVWRDQGASLDLGVAGVYGEDLVAPGGEAPESVVVAYAELAPTQFIQYTSVRVTSGPSSEWSASPWRTLTGATSPSLHATERGVALTAFEPPGKEAPPSLVALWLSEAGESKVERFPLAGPGWRVRGLGDVARAGERWLAVAAIESEPVIGRTSGKAKESKPPVCAKSSVFPPPREPTLAEFDRAYWGGHPPGQGGVAVVSHGPEGSQSLIVETGLLVDPGHLVQLDQSRVAVSFCTRDAGGCYIAVVSLDTGEGALCTAASVTQPVPLAVDGESLAWVESPHLKAQLNSSPALQGLALRKAPKQPVRKRPD